MSFTDDFLKELKKKNISITNQGTVSGGDSYTKSYLAGLSDLEEEKKKRQEMMNAVSSPMTGLFDDDIAPVKKKEDDSKLDFFQKGAFEDGFDWSDIPKAILGTAADVGMNVGKGVLGLAEGITDLAQYGVAGVSDLLGADKAADKIRGGAKKNLVEDLTRGASEWVDQYSVLGRTTDSIAQGLGQVGGIMLTGGLAAGAGLSATAATTGTMFASGMGSGMGEAYQGGASDGEAVAYGAISGAADALTEMLFGGLGKTVNAVGFSKGLSSADDMLAKKISGKISSQLGKNLAEFGVKASGEGFEEVLAGTLQAAGKKATYMSEKEFSDILEDENLLEQFVVGAATSGIIQSGLVPGTQEGSLKESIKENRDFITGQTVNEQAVIKKEIEKRIAEQEKDGRKLTAREKSAIEAQVEADLPKGYISIDTIEETLGGDDFKAYKDTIDSEEALKQQEKDLTDEYNLLNKKKLGDMTGEETDRRDSLKTQIAELQAKIKDTETNSKRDLLKAELSKKVYELSKSDRLVESYLEPVRAKQKFTADVSKYEGKAKEVIQQVMDSGLADNSNATHDFWDMVANVANDRDTSFTLADNQKILEMVKAEYEADGVEFDESKFKGQTIDGFVSKNGIVLNAESKRALNFVVGHEITHTLEKSKHYESLRDALKEYAAKEFDTRFAKRMAQYEGKYNEATLKTEVEMEVIADLVGDFLFTDQNFVNHLSTKNRNVFQKIYDEVKYLLKKATAGSKEARELERVKHLFEKAYRDAGKDTDAAVGLDENGDAGVKYSLVTDQETIDFLENQEHITTYKAMVQIDGKLYAPMASQSRVEETYTDKKGNKKTRTVRKLNNPSVLGQWQQSNERPDIAEKSFNSKRGYSSFDLLKSNGKTVPAAYNPYEHTSNIVLNDQFEEAYNRPELVTVEYHIPVSELTSGYKAEYAKDAVGQHSWKSGPVAKDLKDPRQVYLTRWSKPVRVLSDAEVAQKYKEILDGTGLSVPFNVVTPSLLSELEKVGVDINYDGSPMYQSIQRRAAEKEAVKLSISDDAQKEMEAVAKKVVSNLKHDVMASKYGLHKYASYSSERIEREIADSMADGLPDYAHSYIAWVDPEDFLRATTYTDKYGDHYERIREEAGELDHNRLKGETQPIYLRVDGKTNQIIGHEGRHRISALGKAGYDRVAVILRTNSPNDIGQLLFPEERMKLKGQVFSNDIAKTSNKGLDFWVHNLLPLSEKYADSARKLFSEVDNSIKFSLSDSEGRQLSKEQQDYFKDSKVRDADGNLLKVYHGTPDKFTTFKQGVADGWGKGIYFTDNKAEASTYGENVVEAYLNITNPYNADTMNYYDIGAENTKAYRDYDMEVWKNQYDEYDTYEEYKADGMGADMHDIYREEVEVFNKILRELGYDGIIADGSNGIDGLEIVAFRENQPKLTTNTKPTANPDIRFSLSEETDESYLDAVNRGDTETAQKMVDDAAKAAGYTTKAYHGTYADFFTFDKDRVGKGTDQYGAGFYFASDKTAAGHYGTRVIDSALKIENPFYISSVNLLDAEITLTDEQAYEIVKRHPKIYDPEESPLGDYYDSYWEDGPEDWMVEDLAMQYTDLGYLDSDLFRDYPNELHEAVRDVTGHDGIVVNLQNGERFYIAWFDNQMKAADPATYDDNGNLIPLSERFNTETNDIRHSISDVGEEHPVYGSYHYYSNYKAPVQEDIAPVQEAAQTASVQDILPDDYAPMTEEETAARQSEILDSLTDADMPAEVETEYLEMADAIPLTQKVVKDIAKSVKGMLGLSNNQVGEVYSIVLDYSGREFPSREALFNEVAERFGQYTEKGVDEDLKAIKAELRTARVNVDDAIKNDITDYGQFKKRNFGKIRFSNEGLPVDVVYMELAEKYPGYFPEDIINPSEQLQRMAEIAGYDHNTEQVYELDDEMLLGVTDSIINAVNEFKSSKRAAFAQKTARESFNSLMRDADSYVPPMDGDIGPVAAPAAQAPVTQEAPVDRQKELETIVGDKDSFFSNRAAELYEEVTNLKKGVRASKALGYLLDYGYEWKSLKTALLNIRDNPGQQVNERSAIENIAREMINEEYEDKLYEMGELLDGAKSPKATKTIKERLATKLLNHQTELANAKTLREQSNADYDSEIARLQAEYDARGNKNTVAANETLLRIERMRRMKGNVDADYAKRISDMEAKVAKVKEEIRTGESKAEQGAMRRELHQNIMDRIKTRFAEKGFDFDSVLKKAKNLSTFATVDNTPQRVMEKSLGYKEGQVLSDLTVDQVARNETEGIKWLNKYTDKKNGLLKKISEQYNIKPGSKESAAAQMYAEGFYVAENEDIIEYGDKELAKDFPDARVQANIKGLAKDPRVRQIYDETLALINASRARNAYPEIQKLDNYFLHFRAMSDTFSRLGLPFNPNDIKAKDLPTDLNGVTADLKPGQPYFASAMHRKGQRTSFDLLGGLEQYLTSAKGQIYHIDDIQTLRALRNYIADTFGQAKGLEGLDTMTEEEVQERIKEVYGAHLSTFAKFLNEEANTIAGKTALIDRGLEGIIGRRGITFLDTVNRQVGANMVGYNVSSSLTNFLAPVQAFAKTNKADFVKAFSQTVYNKLASINGKGDGFTEQSPVMIRRKGADRFHRTFWQKLSDPGYALMGAVDSFSTELIARAKYNEFTRKGMDAAQAHIEADKWTSRLMGDRSLGQQPHLYNSKMLGIVTKFQLEVRNQLDSQFYDTIQEAKVSNEDIQNAQERNAKTAAKVASTFFSLAVGQHLFGKAFESIAGYNPAFDIIEALVKAFGWGDDEEDEDTVLDNIGQGFMSLMEDMPYSSVLTGGRIPIQSALPISEFFKGKDQYGNEKSRLETLSEAAPYYLLPGGYGQIKKTVAGLNMFSDEHPVAGSYTDSGNLRFPVEDTLLNRAQAAVFGQYASSNARDYFDNERQSLKKNQIQEFVDVDIPIRDYWAYRDGLKKQETLEDKFDYIAGLDLPISKKNILINNVVDRKEPVDLSDYDAYSGYEEFDFATKNPEKYAFFEEVGISYSAYKNGDDDTKDAYDWAYNNPDKYLLSKAAASDVVEYRRYAKDLYDIKADKDASGKTISGSRKEKVIQYLNNLDIDYGERLILFKSEYEADDTYNADIVEYLNGRDDISFEEEVTILKELGFIVLPDGTVQW